jgi:hypothetical protein
MTPRRKSISQFLNINKEEAELKVKRNTLRSQVLAVDNEQESNQKRVRAEAVDFDWIFNSNVVNGIVSDNAVNMIMLLSDQSRSELFITKAIRIFIELMWSKYQPAIIQ